MIRYLKFVAVTFVLALTTPAFAVQSVAEPTLDVGSIAPEIDVEYWLSRGTDDRFPKVTKFEPGKVYVVEFWATWCPPCIASMPHLSQLQNKYSDSIQIISITNDPLEQVAAFLQRKVNSDQPMTFGQLTKNYCLTADPDGSTKASYDQVKGVRGIPTAFLIGKTGRIECVCHPMELDEPLEMLLAGKFDALAYQKMQREREARQQKLDDALDGIFRMVEGGQTDQGLAFLDAMIDEAREEERSELEYVKVEILSAVGKPTLAVKQINQMLGNAKGDQLTDLKLLKFQIMAAEAMPGAEKIFFEVADLAKGADMQNIVAWSVVQLNLDRKPVSPKMITKARALADASVAVKPTPSVLETQAHLVFMQGGVEQAVTILKQAIAGARGKQLKERLNFFLEEWQSELDPRQVENESGDLAPAPLRQ